MRLRDLDKSPMQLLAANAEFLFGIESVQPPEVMLMSLVHITLLEMMGMSLVWAAAWNHEDIHRLYKTAPTRSPLWLSGEMAPPLASCSTRDHMPCTSPKQHSGAGPDSG